MSLFPLTNIFVLLHTIPEMGIYHGMWRIWKILVSLRLGFVLGLEFILTSAWLWDTGCDWITLWADCKWENHWPYSFIMCQNWVLEPGFSLLSHLKLKWKAYCRTFQSQIQPHFICFHLLHMKCGNYQCCQHEHVLKLFLR